MLCADIPPLTPLCNYSLKPTAIVATGSKRAMSNCDTKTRSGEAKARRDAAYQEIGETVEPAHLTKIGANKVLLHKLYYNGKLVIVRVV